MWWSCSSMPGSYALHVADRRGWPVVRRQPERGPRRRVHPRGDDWMRLAPGLHRIGSDVVNVYLIEDAAGITIVDAGLPGHWRELERELTQLGHSLDDVRGVVLTHG